MGRRIYRFPIGKHWSQQASRNKSTKCKITHADHADACAGCRLNPCALVAQEPTANIDTSTFTILFKGPSIQQSAPRTSGYQAAMITQCLWLFWLSFTHPVLRRSAHKVSVLR